MTARKTGFVALWGLALLIVLPGSLDAKVSPNQGQAVSFNIPPSELAYAIQTFEKQSGANFPVLLGEHIFGRRTAGVTGTMPPREALQRLLQGTGLVFSQDQTGRYYLAKPVSFNIPPGDLFDRIRLIADQGGEWVNYGPETLGKRTDGVTGTMATRDALERLLRGTGLDFEFVGGAGFVVQAPKKPQPAGSESKARPTAAGEKTTFFNIPAGNLFDAMMEFRNQSGAREVRMPVEESLRVRTEAVREALTPEKALARLLEGTNLGFVYLKDDDSYCVVQKGEESSCKPQR